MREFEWIFWLVSETLKYAFFSIGVAGFRVRHDRYQFLALGYLAAGIPILCYLHSDSLVYRTLWCFVFSFSFLQGKYIKIIQIFFLQYILIATADLFFLSIFLNVTGNDIFAITFPYQCIVNGVGIIFWALMACLVGKRRAKVRAYFEELSAGYYILILLIVSGLAVIVASVQISLYHEATDKIRRVALFACVLVMIFLIVICVVLVYMIYSRKWLTYKNEMDQECLNYQRKYYDSVLEKDEGMRKIHHDFKKHIAALRVLSDNNNLPGLKDYINQLDQDYRENSSIYTGNEIADYFINVTVEEIRATGPLEFTMVGRFPSEMQMEDMDLCILLANALENARDELLKQKENRVLKLEIKNYERYLFITVSNSLRQQVNFSFETEKKNKKRHGYGTKNMKKVVEKYQGTIRWTVQEEMLAVEIQMVC